MQAKLRAKIPANGPKFISGDLCLDVVDYILQYRSIPAEELSALECRLEDGGSAWRATSRGLERRVDATLQNAAESVFETETRPAQHLRDAWQKAWGRSPDASAAYTNAVRAVEAAYAPIVSPKNGQATLGSIIADIKNKPSKFEVRLQEDTPGANVDRLIGVLQMLWKSQLDRHGTADESVPLNVSIDEARDAVALATTLVHLAQQGGFSANGN